ncbi:hypothetical protein P7C70_g309, partial [Phenoliferia sp. Uapishka_3]
MSKPLSSVLRATTRRVAGRSTGVANRAYAAARPIPTPTTRERWGTAAALLGVAGVFGAASWSLRPDLVPSLPFAHAEEAGVYIDPTTSTPFPSTISSPNGTVLQLVGTGVRTVSFLSIRVYSAGIHIAAEAVDKIQAGKLAGWEGYTPARLTPPYPADAPQLCGEALIGQLLNEKYEVAVTIVPLRNTTLPHLRDGFSRALVARLKLPHVASAMSPEETEAASTKLPELRSFFPGKALAKGTPLVCHFSPTSVRFELPDPKDPAKTEVLGVLVDPFLTRQLFLSYFSDAGAISEELRASVAKGLAGEARRN